MKYLQVLYYIFILFLCYNCSSSKIETGDIVFRSVTNNELSAAINDVTQTSKKSNYTHMGVCEVINDTVYIYHADSDKGVVKEPVQSFYTSKEHNFNVDVYRIKNITKTQKDSAILKAKKLINQPYDTTYILESKGFYCSEYVYEIFKSDSVFKLEPMTFKNPKSNTYHDGWIKHYNALGIEIPEGKLGCNPNGMANSKRLEFIKTVKK